MMTPPISITGPNSLDHKSLLLSASAPDWFGAWNTSANLIIEELRNGKIPYTNIAALAYKIIVFYSKTKGSPVVWSSPQEVFSLLEAQFESAVSDENRSALQEYMTSFGVLIEEFCIEIPVMQIVWDSDNKPGLLSEQFGMCHEPCAAIRIKIPDDQENTDEEWAEFVESAVTPEKLAGLSFSNTECLFPNKSAETPSMPFNFL